MPDPHAPPRALTVTWFGFTPIHGVPVVKPADAVASHCTGVRELSRLPDAERRRRSCASVSRPWARASAAKRSDSMSR